LCPRLPTSDPVKRWLALGCLVGPAVPQHPIPMDWQAVSAAP